MYTVPVPHGRKVFPELQSVLLHILWCRGVLPDDHGREAQIDALTGRHQAVDETIELHHKLIQSAWGYYPSVGALPGNVLIGSDLERALGR